MVETNTMAASMGGHCEGVARMHQHFENKICELRRRLQIQIVNKPDENCTRREE